MRSMGLLSSKIDSHAKVIIRCAREAVEAAGSSEVINNEREHHIPVEKVLDMELIKALSFLQEGLFQQLPTTSHSYLQIQCYTF